MSLQVDYSIIIPTWNRESLVDALLKSLHQERSRYSQGETEVLVVDSSTGESRESIRSSCARYEAQYIDGEDSVRKKRNKGIRLARYDTILFLDSDVTVMPGLLDAFTAGWQNPRHVKLGGLLGLTEFVGERSRWWKILEKTSLVNSFSFAKDYPFQSWTIGNNVSFRKKVLEEVGLFEENFPFRLGGDDLDLSYRVTKVGYMIGSVPEAVTCHSRTTWNNYHAVHDRAKRWGTMEYYITERHPELFRRVIPRNYVLEILVLLLSAVASLISRRALPVLTALVWIVACWMIGYMRDILSGGGINPVYYFGGRFVQDQYEFYRVRNYIVHKKWSVFTNGIVFNRFQIRFGTKDDCKRVQILAFSYAAVLTATMILAG